MKNLSLKQLGVVLILALLTVLEPLSIDLYLPGFLEIAGAFKTTTSSVQISLSTFLGGFAVGQLIWGPLADKYGRKKPVLASLGLFIIASFVCIHVQTIEELWVARFFQALGGSGGIVIARAIVTDYFEESETLSVFALLALITGVAPIVGPAIGNFILEWMGWIGLFEAMVVLGVLCFISSLLLPETHKSEGYTVDRPATVKAYLSILKERKFIIYSVIAGTVYGALMIYIGAAPFVMIEKGGFSGSTFSLIFGINAIGLMLSSYLTVLLKNRFSSQKMMNTAIVIMFATSMLLAITMFLELDIKLILLMLFLYVFPIGILFPTTTDLVMKLFSKDISGMVSSLFGAVQLTIAFLFSALLGIVANGSLWVVGTSFLICTAISFITMVISKRVVKNPGNKSNSGHL